MTKPKISAKSVFEDAVKLPPEQRGAFLDNVCRTAPKIRLRVEAMLADHDHRGVTVAAPGPVQAEAPEETATPAAAPVETQDTLAGTLPETAEADPVPATPPRISAEALRAATGHWFVPVEVESWRAEIAARTTEGLDAASKPFLVATKVESWRTEPVVTPPESSAEAKVAGPPANWAGVGPAGQEGSQGAGTRLGRYSIVEPLGSGPMGVVYRALDTKLDRPVTIRMLAPGVLKGDQARRNFRRGALALAKMSHPNIAAVYEVGEQDGQDYIVMEWVPGESLAAKLGAGAMAVREATAILMEVAEALVEAHDHGIIHRDLKPANVVITPKGHAKVLDFGMAKLLAGSDAALSKAETQGLVGTQRYLSPEQALGEQVDERSDLWSLGAMYYECLTGLAPFGEGSGREVLRPILENPVRPEAAEHIAARALKIDPVQRYQEATEMVRDAWNLLKAMGDAGLAAERRRKLMRRGIQAAAAVLVLAATAWLFHWNAKRKWAREQAIPEVTNLMNAHQPLAAWMVLKKAQGILPADARIQGLVDRNTAAATITSDPPGTLVEIQDYLTPGDEWQKLGTTPLTGIRIPKGYFRWRLSKDGFGTLTEAPEAAAIMSFPLAEAQKSPVGMVYDPGGIWSISSGTAGKQGPYNLPPFYIDRYEVTNREYQAFVDRGGYATREYWPAAFQQNGRTLAWSDAMGQFRDSTGRPGPSTWADGHYPVDKADFPVSGVSWYEAAAYASFAGKTLPTLGEWYQADPPDVAGYTVQLSNIGSKGPDAVGTYRGVGPYGTYDMAGNVREWLSNVVDDDMRFAAGGSWKSMPRQAADPMVLSPYDRVDGNGFRCVRNLAPLPDEAARPVRRAGRNAARSGR